MSITRLKGFGAAAAVGLIVFVGLSGPSLKRVVDWLVPSLFHDEHPELAQAAVEPIVVPVVKELFAKRVEKRAGKPESGK
jgi:hypothetical protein